MSLLESKLYICSMVAAMMHRKQPTRTVQVCVCVWWSHTNFERD